MFSGEHLSVEHVDLEIADTQARDELPGLAVGRAPAAIGVSTAVLATVLPFLFIWRISERTAPAPR